MEIRELLRLYIDESTLEYGENSTAWQLSALILSSSFEHESEGVSLTSGVT